MVTKAKVVGAGALAALLLGAPQHRLGSAESTLVLTDSSLLRFASAEVELRHWLQHYGLDNDWVRVARLEAGWKLNSTVALKANNVFGMHYPVTRPSSVVGRFNQYARYRDLKQCVEDLALWVALNPRPPEQPFDQWLKLRKWNPFDVYWQLLAQIPA